MTRVNAGEATGGPYPPAPEVLRRVESLVPHMGYIALAPGNTAPFKSEEAKLAIEGALSELFPDDEWQAEGFDLLPALKATKGPFVEIGGPSPRGYDLVDLAEVFRTTGKKIVVTNLQAERLSAPVPEEMRKAIEIGGLQDVRHLQFKKKTVGAFFTNGLGFYASPYLFRHSTSMLEKDGLLIAGYLSGLEVADALHLGLALKAYSTHIQKWSDGYESRTWQTVFQRVR